MSSNATTYKINERSALRTILIATLVAGTLDITAAIISTILNGREVTKMFQFIASGIFGRETAFAGGTGMTLMGLLFHFCIAFLWSALLFIIYPGLKSFLRYKVLIGVLYGIFVWLVMNKVVLPLSRTPAISPTTKQMIIGCLIIIFCIGIPISLIVDRFYARSRA